ncbi:unnamed protein product, partial [Pylaiella littoralis]
MGTTGKWSASEGPKSTLPDAPPTEPITSTEESKKETRKRKHREVVARGRVERKRKRESEARAQKSAAIKAEHAKAREETLERLKNIATSQLTEDHLKLFGEMFDDGDLLEGESDFPRERGGKGLKNGWFFARLRWENASAAGKSRRVREPTCFWTDGKDRLDRLTRVFKACVAAGIPLMVKKDAPEKSVMGICAREAVGQGYVGLGSKGRVSTTDSFPVDDEVVDDWIGRCVDRNYLNGHTWLLQTHTITERIENSKKLRTIKSAKAIRSVKNAGMARMCFPQSGVGVTIDS